MKRERSSFGNLEAAELPIELQLTLYFVAIEGRRPVTCFRRTRVGSILTSWRCFYRPQRYLPWDTSSTFKSRLKKNYELELITVDEKDMIRRPDSFKKWETY